MLRTRLFFWVIIFLLAVGVIGSRTFQRGMFMDGLLYATVAHNLHQGLGTFWFPVYDITLRHFDQQPPLFMYILSLFYDWFGSSEYVEKSFSFLLMLCSIGLMVLIWKKISYGQTMKNTEWLPVILFLTIPVVPWSFSNNMIENLVLNFCLLSVYLFLHEDKYGLWAVLAASFVIIVSSLTKGLQASFTIIFMLLYGYLIKPEKLKTTLIYFFISVIIFVGFYFILFSIPEPKKSLMAFWNNRVMNSIQNVSNVESRFYLWFRLFFVELLPMEIVLAGAILLCGHSLNRSEFIRTPLFRYSVLFIALGLCGSLPLIITKEQRGFYLMNSFPFFSLGFGVILFKILESSIEKFEKALSIKFIRIFSVTMVIVSISMLIFHFGKTGRDEIELHDAKQIAMHIKNEKTIFSSGELIYKYNFLLYLNRYHGISVIFRDEEKYPFMVLADTQGISLRFKYEKLSPNTRKYHLWKKINPQQN
ncbi:MAG: hypothetical protein N3F09_02825 [Bacteroidia bacterium]|nr:hypothetical protein [Bacteroidia bacterium]